MKKLLIPFILFILLTAGYAIQLTSCYNYDACYSDWVETSFSPSQNIDLEKIQVCISGLSHTTNFITVYEWSGVKGSGYTSDGLYNSTNIGIAGSCAIGGGTWYRIRFDSGNEILEAGKNYWFAWDNITDVGCMWGKTSSCDSLTPQGAGTNWGGVQIWTYGNLWGDYMPDINITSPVNNSIVSQDFNFNVDVQNFVTCDSPQELYRAWYYKNGDSYYLIASNTTTPTGDGIIEWIINTSWYGTDFRVSSWLVCNSSVIDSQNNYFGISLTNIVSNYANESLLKSIYSPLCFNTPLPEDVCNTTEQDIYVYINGELYYNLNNTEETEICIRDRNLDGLTNITIKTYCSDSQVLIDSQTYNYEFQYQLKYQGIAFSGFMDAMGDSFLKVPIGIIIGVSLLLMFVTAFTMLSGVVNKW